MTLSSVIVHVCGPITIKSRLDHGWLKSDNIFTALAHLGHQIWTATYPIMELNIKITC